MRRWAKLAAAAGLVLAPALAAAQIPFLTGPQDVSQMRSILNELIRRINLALYTATAPRIPAQNYGNCIWDGTHDVASCLSLAFSAAADQRGIVTLPPFAATYPISTAMSVATSYVGLDCGGTGLKWTGATGGRMLAFLTPYGSTANKRLQLNSASNCTFDGNGTAADGIYGQSLFKPFFKNVTLTGFNLALTAATPAAPTLGQTPGGAIGATTYYARIAYTDDSGHETAGSAEASFAVGANNLLTVTSPGASGNATGYNVFVGTAAGQSYLQNASPITLGTGWTEPTSGLIAGRQIRTFNNSGSAFIMDIVPAVNGVTFGEPTDYQNANIEGLQINNAAYTSNGIYMSAYVDATGPHANASYNNFIGSQLIQVGGSNAVGLICEGCDNNGFDDIRIYGTNSVELTVYTYDANNLFSANGMNFGHLYYSGTFIVRGTSTYACSAYTTPLPARVCPRANQIYALDATNGTPDPDIRAGANLNFGRNDGQRTGFSFFGTTGTSAVVPGLTVSNSLGLRNSCTAHAQGLTSGIFLCSNDSSRMLNMWGVTGGDEYYLRFAGSAGALNLELQHPTGTGNFVISPRTNFANGLFPNVDLTPSIGAASSRFADIFTKRLIDNNGTHNWILDFGIGASPGDGAFDVSHDGTSRINVSAAGTITLNGTTIAVPPTSCAGLAAGTLWNNAGTPAICP